MRLTVDLINQSLSYLNPLKERELDLRGNKLPQIENLGGATDHDSLDLTDNDIPIVSGFPLMPRLQTLLLARNRIAVITPGLERSIPNLRTLQLENNRVTELADLDALMGLSKLEHVVLMGNPVCRKENYRLWVLWRAPSVRYLDFVKVKDAEREKAKQLFGTREEPTQLAEQIAGKRSREAENPDAFATAAGAADVSEKGGAGKLTAEQKKEYEEAIKNAKTLKEMVRLEQAFNSGKALSDLKPGR